MLNLALERELLSRLEIQRNGCWFFVGGTSEGYGWLNRERVHVTSFKLFKGCVPEDMCVCHTCDEPLCFNPDHLYLGTRADNIKDMWALGRGYTPDKKGSANGQAKLLENDIIQIRKLLESGYSQTEISIGYGVDNTTIWKIAKGKTWSHV